MDFYRKTWLMIGVYAAVAGVFWGASAWFKADISRRTGRIAEAEGRASARQAAEKSIALLTADSAKADALLPALTGVLPDQDSLIDFPREAALLARQYGLEFSLNFGAGTPGTTTTPGSVAFAAAGKGPGAKWAEFLRAFESSKRVVSLDQVRMATVDGKSYDVNIDGKVFSQ